MAFIDDQERVFRQILEQSRRRVPCPAAGKVAGVILNPGAHPGGFHHFNIEGAALLQPFNLQQPSGGGKLGEPALQFDLDVADRLGQGRARGDIVRIGVNGNFRQICGFLPS